MAERPRYLSEEQRQFALPSKCIECLSNFREGILDYRLPNDNIQIGNYRQLFKHGVIGVFAEQSQSISNPNLKMYFTDDFSKICLREKDKSESLLSIGIDHDINSGAVKIVGIAKKNILSPWFKNNGGLITLGNVLQGVVQSYEHGLL